VLLKNDRGQEAGEFRPGEDLTVEIAYDAQRRLEKPYVTLVVAGVNGSCFTANMMLDGHRPESLDGMGQISCRFSSLPLLPQNYTVRMIIRAKNGHDMILKDQDVASFRVVGDLTEYGYKGEFLARAVRYTPVVVPYEWRLPDGTTASVSLESPPK